MSRYIDADALKEHTEVVSYKNEWYETEIDEFVSVENIDSAPSIEIVRCGECKWWRKEAYLDCNRMVLVDMCTRPTALGTLVKADDFCSYGKVSEKPTGSEKPNNSKERSSE